MKDTFNSTEADIKDKTGIKDKTEIALQGDGGTTFIGDGGSAFIGDGGSLGMKPTI